MMRLAKVRASVGALSSILMILVKPKNECLSKISCES